MDGIGWDAYEEHFWEQRIIRFEYTYVGLPALDGEPYVTGENLLGVALSALMRLPANRRGELYAEGLKRIACSEENDYRRFLLAACLEAYADLDEAQTDRLRALLHTEAYQEVEPAPRALLACGARPISVFVREPVTRALAHSRIAPLPGRPRHGVGLAQPPDYLLRLGHIEELA